MPFPVRTTNIKFIFCIIPLLLLPPPPLPGQSQLHLQLHEDSFVYCVSGFTLWLQSDIDLMSLMRPPPLRLGVMRSGSNPPRPPCGGSVPRPHTTAGDPRPPSCDLCSSDDSGDPRPDRPSRLFSRPLPLEKAENPILQHKSLITLQFVREEN